MTERSSGGSLRRAVAKMLLLVAAARTPTLSVFAQEPAGDAIRFTKALFPVVMNGGDPEFRAVVVGDYGTGQVRIVSIFVAKASDMESAMRAATPSEINALPLFARFGLTDEEFESIHFEGQAVHWEDNRGFGAEVDSHKDWSRDDALRALARMAVQCATKDQVLASLPLAALQVAFGPVRVDAVEFPDPSERGGEGGTPRGAPYLWNVTLRPQDHPREVYSVGVEPFVCAVTYVIRGVAR